LIGWRIAFEQASIWQKFTNFSSFRQKTVAAMYILQLLTALCLDLLFGDPRGYPHPVRLIGRLCSYSETLYRKMFSSPEVAGFFTVLSVILLSTGSVSLLLVALGTLAPWLATLTAIFFLYSGIAIRDLQRHSKAVASLLGKGAPLDAARQALAQIVGRDTADLSEEKICRATLETVAENMVDGITAPLFYAVLASLASPLLGYSPIACSAVGIVGYKAINTMDSMIAYKNDRYLRFGRTAARLDDLANFVPARLSGLCLIIAAFFLKFDYREAARIYFRDRLRHASPNSGHSEAAVAGALGLDFGGPSAYQGILVEKPIIGDRRRLPEVEDIRRVNHLVFLGSAIFVAVLVGLREVLAGW
jgi:adenosylcobinamide-phosphate synthase